MAISQLAVDDVITAEEERYEANISLDMERLNSLLAREFTYHQPTGTVANKMSYLEQIESGAPAFISAEFLDTDIEVYGNVAVSKGIVSVQIVLENEEQYAKLRYLNVWVLRDGRLQLVARQSAFVQ